MNKKISTPLAILIILLVIAAIIGVTLWICPIKDIVSPQDETADWKTYRNEEYGFEIKYPKEWMFNAESVGGRDNFLQIHLSNFQRSDDPICDLGFIGLGIQVGHTKYSEQDFKSSVEHIINTDWMGPKGSIIKETIINGHKCFEVKPSGGDSLCLGSAYFIEQNENHYIRATSGSHNNNQQEASEIINKILSSFEFID